MGKADEEQDCHPAVEGPELPFRVRELDAEAHAEKQGEYGVEFPVHQEGLHRTGNLVRGSPPRRIREGPQGELREIGKDNSEDGKTAEGIEYYIAFLFHKGQR